MEGKKNLMWNIGQLSSLALGVLAGYEFASIAVGLSLFFGLGVLVDIRHEVID